MRLSKIPLAPLAGVFLLLGSVPLGSAHPYARDDLHDAGFGYLVPRDCAQYCGYQNMYCCSAGSSCYTSNGIAGCSAAAGGGVAWYTTTWTLTQTFTSTLSSWVPVQTASPGQDCIPEAGSGWIACGNICCASWQYCAFRGQCSANGPPPAGATYTTVISSVTTVITTQYSAPYRVTGTESGTATQTGGSGAATTTSSGNGTAVAGTSGAQLSPGAIAGIVIGALAGVVILLLICVCCVMRGLWHTVLGLLGLGKKKERRTETIIEEERYSRHGSVHGRRENHGGWFGGGGGRPSTVASRKEKKKSSGMGWLGLAGAAGTLMLLLGLRRDNKRKAQSRARSEVSSSYWSESYTGTNPSSTGSRRTRRTERSQRTRTTRVSRAPSRVPSRAPSHR